MLGLLVDRLSINIELPTEKSLALLAPEKTFEDIFSPMDHVKNQVIANKDYRKKYKNSPKFVPAGQTSQMIIGASDESDRDIIHRSEALYKTYKLKRVYYSAFVPVVKSKITADILEAPLAREHRIYQADWLLRFYGFRAEDLLDDENKNFDLDIDPKANWAINNIDKFPIEINTASYNELLKIPGIGKVSAKKIINARKFRKLSYDNLKAMKISTKRARYFITVGGKYEGVKFKSKEQLRAILTCDISDKKTEQLTLWSML